MLAMKQRVGGLPVVFTGADGSVNVSGSGSSVYLAQPADTRIGMLVLAAMAASGGARTWSGPAGLTEHADQAALPNLRIATKIADADGYVSLGNVTLSSSGDTTRIGLAIVRGAYDTIGAFGTRSGVGTLTAPGITMSAGGLLLAIVAMEDDGGTIASDSSMPLIKNFGSGIYPEIGIFGEYVGAGATGSRSFTIGGTLPGACSAVLVGIKRG